MLRQCFMTSTRPADGDGPGRPHPRPGSGPGDQCDAPRGHRLGLGVLRPRHAGVRGRCRDERCHGRVDTAAGLRRRNRAPGGLRCAHRRCRAPSCADLASWRTACPTGAIVPCRSSPRRIDYVSKLGSQDAFGRVIGVQTDVCNPPACPGLVAGPGRFDVAAAYFMKVRKARTRLLCGGRRRGFSDRCRVS